MVRAVECLIKDRDALPTFCDFPAAPRQYRAALGLKLHPGLLHLCLNL
jgi:hypothetical protein